ncbi:hypothetical protein HY641_01035 [Candidatus Woesearchaeota archaeon]|nr:hypothetical protein [Candidatus Woesearchaeota archaeon]
MQHNEIHHDTTNPEHDHNHEDEHQADEEMIVSERDQKEMQAEASAEERTDAEAHAESHAKGEAHESEDRPDIQETEEMQKLREKLQEIRGPYLKLKWDAEHDQINPGQKTRYDKLKKEYEELEIALRKELEKIV